MSIAVAFLVTFFDAVESIIVRSPRTSTIFIEEQGYFLGIHGYAVFSALLGFWYYSSVASAAGYQCCRFSLQQYLGICDKY
jgi:hypothetical protein